MWDCDDRELVGKIDGPPAKDGGTDAAKYAAPSIKATAR
jgi:hypothetical protein